MRQANEPSPPPAAGGGVRRSARKRKEMAEDAPPLAGAAVVPSVPRAVSAREENVLIIGSVGWTERELDYLGPFIAAINVAASSTLMHCAENASKYGISVMPSRFFGKGLFCAKGMPYGTYVGMYIGELYPKDKVPGNRHNYCMALPDIVFPWGRTVPVVVCGYERREVPGLPNASMLNHSCDDNNVLFFPEDVGFYANFNEYQKLRRMENDPAQAGRITDAFRSRATQTLFSYTVVVALVSKRDGVAAGSELLVTYNRADASGAAAAGSRGNYFVPKDVAEASCEPGETAVPCACGPGGVCPRGLYFVKSRDYPDPA